MVNFAISKNKAEKRKRGKFLMKITGMNEENLVAVFPSQHRTQYFHWHSEKRRRNVGKLEIYRSLSYFFLLVTSTNEMRDGRCREGDSLWGVCVSYKIFNR